MKAGLLILARTGSTRLPKKVLLKVMGRPILEYLIERLRGALRPCCTVLCTTQLAEDDVLVDVAIRNGLQTFRGSEEDVVDRMIQAAHQYQLDFVVSIGGDDIFCDPVYVDHIIEWFERTKADFIYCPDLPLGASPYGVKTEALEKLFQIKMGGTDGWERYFQETGVFQVIRIPLEVSALRRSELRMTLDYPEDFEFFKEVLETLYPQNPLFTLQDVIALMDHRPDLTELSQKRVNDWYRERESFNIVIKGHTAEKTKEEK